MGFLMVQTYSAIDESSQEYLAISGLGAGSIEEYKHKR